MSDNVLYALNGRLFPSFGIFKIFTSFLTSLNNVRSCASHRVGSQKVCRHAKSVYQVEVNRLTLRHIGQVFLNSVLAIWTPVSSLELCSVYFGDCSVTYKKWLQRNLVHIRRFGSPQNSCFLETFFTNECCRHYWRDKYFA